MTDEERQEEARRKAAEAQAKADWEREVARRRARAELAKSQPSLIVHSPVQK